MKTTRLLLPALLLICSGLHLLAATTTENFTALATLSARATKPGKPLELLVTVRSAERPAIQLPQDLGGMKVKNLRQVQPLLVDGEHYWLSRYRITPMQVGEYEIPPIQVLVGNRLLQTKPLLLHVSQSGVLPPLSPRELALGVDIPPALSEEVLKAAPQPPPLPEPTPKPRDLRAWPVQATSAARDALTAFWNYPGK